MTDEDFDIFAGCFCKARPIPRRHTEIDGKPQYDDDNKPNYGIHSHST